MLLKSNVHFSGLLVHDDRDEGPMCFTAYSANPADTVFLVLLRDIVFFAIGFNTGVLWYLIMTEQQVKVAAKDCLR